MILFFLALSFLSPLFASEINDLYEKTYTRDNTFCRGQKNRIEVLIRGDSKNTEPNEVGFGEYLFLRDDQKKLTLLEINKSRSDTYRFFYGQKTACSKSLGYAITNTLAVLLLKENNPFKEKLVIHFFDSKTMKPKDFIETDYVTDSTEEIQDGFAFNSLGERLESEIGKITIDGIQYTYQDRDFAKWIGYTSKGFEILPKLTFEKNPLRESFKDENDFMKTTGWDQNLKIFTKNFLYYAVNYAAKKNCFLFMSEKKKLDGTEPWRCQTI